MWWNEQERVMKATGYNGGAALAEPNVRQAPRPVSPVSESMDMLLDELKRLEAMEIENLANVLGVLETRLANVLSSSSPDGASGAPDQATARQITCELQARIDSAACGVNVARRRVQASVDHVCSIVERLRV